ncbi:SusC/RagA family TonB-linked outer membrane protein [Sphingobacterium spiritivorum]|uniref:SusC/RagA family TonB-linked outer membrane protein n=1 Tax=Sphingobacterium spiritivorum TaxID=258 RepID=UPI003DA61DFC
MKSKPLQKSLAIVRALLLPVNMATFLTLGMVTMASANTFAQRITLKADNQSLRNVLQTLEKESGYFFLYENNVVDNKRLTIQLEDATISQALEKIAKEENLAYKIVNKTITLFHASATVKQDSHVNGKVLLKDTDNPIPYSLVGVTVQVKGTANAVKTNNAGEFNIKAEKNSILIISYIGFQKKEITVSNPRVPLNIVLEQSNDYLDEVIVTGYGTKETKANQVGSAFTLTSKDLERRPALRIDALLEGVVPGVQFQAQDQNNSSPRSRFSTRIRGESSAPNGNASNEPLWVLDGVPLYTGGTTNMTPGLNVSISPLTYLNPDDIESITVLKDATATSIYGANGSNGVILVTTKKGKGPTRIGYNFRGGLQKINDTKFKVLNGDQYRQVIADMGMSKDIAMFDPTVNTNWYDEYFRTGVTKLHNLSVSGSSENNSYYLSAGIYDQKGTTIANDTKRYSLKSNVETKIGNRITARVIVGGAYNVNNLFLVGDEYYLGVPIVNPYLPNGDFALRDERGNRLMNSLAEAAQNDWTQKTLDAFTSGGVDIQIFKGLMFRNNSGLNYTSSNEDQYKSMYNLSGQSENGSAQRQQTQVTNWVTTNTMNYDNQLWQGSLSAKLGMEATRTQRHSVSATGSNFPNDNIREVSFVAENNRRGTTSRDDKTSLSYFGYLNYVWNDKYAFSGTLRKNGDSNFGKNVKWGTFGSYGAAWTVSKEEFWKSKVVDFLKLKASYGTTGNSRFGSDLSKGIYTYSADYGYGGNTGAIMTTGINEDLRWEKTYMFNTGIDARIYKKINVAVEYYNNITKDLINNALVSMTVGQRAVYRNVGKLKNEGVEVSINSVNIEREDFSWSTSFNLSHNVNKVLELYDGFERSSGTTIMTEGYDSRSHYLVRWAGVDPATGDPMWYDINGNVTKTYSANDRVIIGSPNPDFYGGITNRIKYKKFDLSFLVLYRKGGLSFNRLARNNESDGLNILSANQSVNILDHWQYPGYLALTPRLSNLTTSSTLNSTRYLMGTSNIRLQNVSLGYDLTSNWTKAIGLKTTSAYIQGDNLYMWVPNGNSKRNTYKNSFEGMPQETVISLGLNVAF